eukprot:gene4532-5648_t
MTLTTVVEKKRKDDSQDKPTIEEYEDNDTKISNNDEEEEDDDDVVSNLKKKRKKVELARKDCPYLDTVNRSVLDFDFKKICSVSFNNHNVYACLVCGKYFQGKSQDSYANLHCLQMNHHVFINLHNQKIYCLPDDYEVIDASLDDIKYLLNPTFTSTQIKNLDTNSTYSRALDGTQYLPGIVGLNNAKNTAYVNVIIQSLARVPILRDYFIDQNNIKDNKSPLVTSFSELIKKIWNPKNFKAQVSPHELLQAIQNSSQRRFTIGTSSDPLDFLLWFLNTLHHDLGGSKKQNSSIIYQAFSGEVQVTTQKPIKNKLNDKDNDGDASQDKDDKNSKKEENESKAPKQYTTSTIKQPFLFLSLDLPSKPVFKDEQDKNLPPGSPKAKFNLLATIKHEGDPKSGIYSVYVNHKGSNKWFEMQDLTCKETMPQLIAVSECYFLIYEQI